MNKHLMMGALGLSLACCLQPAMAEEKVLRLFNWADYFAPTPWPTSRKRPASASSTT